MDSKLLGPICWWLYIILNIYATVVLHFMKIWKIITPIKKLFGVFLVIMNIAMFISQCSYYFLGISNVHKYNVHNFLRYFNVHKIDVHRFLKILWTFSFPMFTTKKTYGLTRDADSRCTLAGGPQPLSLFVVFSAHKTSPERATRAAQAQAVHPRRASARSARC